MTDAWGRYRLHIASITNTPAARPASASVRASAELTAIGFSINTCLPAAIAARPVAR